MLYWQSEGKKLLLTLRNFPDSSPFLEPVDWKKMGLTDYPSIIKYPMDLTTMATKLSNKEYKSISEFESDFRFIVSNCQIYNAEFSEVYMMASRMGLEFDRLLPNVENAWKEESDRIIQNLKKHKNAIFFLEPVDWKSLGLTDYLQIVTHPMDLGTLEKNLGKTKEEFIEKLDSIWTNCMKYNADGSEVYKMASSMKVEADKLVRSASFVDGVIAETKKKSKKRDSSENLHAVGISLFPLEDDRREDVLRLGRRFALLENDFLTSAIKFVHSKCPKAIRAVDDETVDVDMEIIAKDSSCSNSINQLVKVMLYLQSNPE